MRVFPEQRSEKKPHVKLRLLIRRAYVSADGAHMGYEYQTRDIALPFDPIWCHNNYEIYGAEKLEVIEP